jgi:hypothetical protein
MTATAAGTLWYAYAVVAAGAEGSAPLGDELELVRVGDVAVVATRVPASDFGEDVLPARLNDRAWLERAVQEHDRVVQQLLASGAVVPLRFGSLHRDRRALEEFLQSRRDEFATALDRVRGHVELGLKVWLAKDGGGDDARPPASGRDYLERQRAARDRRAAASAEVGERLRDVHERLLRVADAGVLNRPQARELTGDPRPMVMNAAYLVPAGDAALAAEVDRLADEHPQLAFELTGPWAPYNFVEAASA